MTLNHGEPPQGLHEKYAVSRTDGADQLGQRHYGCETFTMDLTHDRYARTAALAYAGACENDKPELARELRAMIDRLSRAAWAETLTRWSAYLITDNGQPDPLPVIRSPEPPPYDPERWPRGVMWIPEPDG